ncbi:MAG: hypothetical protein AAF532_14885 [Planctomycetota bacterium]
MSPRLFAPPVCLLLAAATCLAEPPDRLAQGVYELRGGTRLGLADDAPKYRTTLSFVIIAGPTQSLASQQWARRIGRFGHAVQVRGAIPGDELIATEKVRGRLRDVKVVGQIARDGRLVFPGEVFTPTDLGPLSEWLNDLQTYGAQGAPDGQARWGLNAMQFEGLSAAMTAVVDLDLLEQTPRDAVAAVAPPSYAVRYTIDAEKLLDRLDVAPPDAASSVAADVRGLARGTTLAVVLNRVGLGFRPERTPEGVVELVVEPLDDLETPWPVGGTLEGTRRADAAPAMFTQFDGGFDDTFARFARLVTRTSGIPLLADHAGIAADGIDLADVRVTIPPRRTSLSLMLRSATLPHRLTREIRVDEAGNPFVWVLPARTKRGT